MSSISRSHAIHPSVTTPVLVSSLPQPVRAPQHEVAERVPASAHVAAGAAGVDLTTSAVPLPAGEPVQPASGIRFLGAGWAADAALFAQYRRRGN